MVPKPDYLEGIGGSRVPERVRSQSLFPGANLGQNGPFSGPPDGRFRGFLPQNPRAKACGFGSYSAASASSDFGFPDDIMKSLMRGTISERKREPLNTP
jgi:hypothetical protein